MKNKINYLYILFAAALWGTTGIFINFLSDYGFSTGQLSALRVGLNVIIIGIYILLTNKSNFKIKLKDIWVFVGTGILSFAFFTYCYYNSIKLNGMAIGAVLLYTAPIFVVILSGILFKDKITVPKIIAIFLSVLGCALVSGVFSSKGDALTPFGFLVGLGSGIGYALYSIFGKFAIDKKYSSMTITFYTFLFASFVAVLMGFVEKSGVNSITPKCLLVIIAYAVVTGFLPYVLYTKGLEKTKPSIASLTATLEPVVATVLGALVFSEVLNLGAFGGIIMILVSLVIAAVL